MKENLFKIIFFKKGGGEDYFCNVRFFFNYSYFPYHNSWGLIDSDHSKQQWVKSMNYELFSIWKKGKWKNIYTAVNFMKL